MKGSSVKIVFDILFVLGLLFVRSASADVPKRIYLALWDGCEEACRGFKDYLQAERANVILIERNAGKDPDKIAGFVEEIKASSPDLLVTWGTYLTLKTVGTEKEALQARFSVGVPTVFMVVSQPVESGLVSALVSQGRNMTGVPNLVPVSEQLQAARQFLPFKRLALIYNPAEVNAAVAAAQVKKYAALMDFEVIDKPLLTRGEDQADSNAVANAVAEAAQKKADLIYLGPDAFMNVQRDILTETATSFGIPVFSAAEGAVRNGGALFAYVNRYYTVGRFAGVKALKILRNKVPAYDIPIETPQRGVYVVNMTAAAQLKTYPPLSFVQATDFVNIPDNQ